MNEKVHVVLEIINPSNVIYLDPSTGKVYDKGITVCCLPPLFLLNIFEIYVKFNLISIEFIKFHIICILNYLHFPAYFSNKR